MEIMSETGAWPWPWGTTGRGPRCLSPVQCSVPNAPGRASTLPLSFPSGQRLMSLWGLETAFAQGEIGPFGIRLKAGK